MVAKTPQAKDDVVRGVTAKLCAMGKLPAEGTPAVPTKENEGKALPATKNIPAPVHVQFVEGGEWVELSYCSKGTRVKRGPDWCMVLGRSGRW